MVVILQRIILLFIVGLLLGLPVRAGNSEIFSYHCPLGCPTSGENDLAVVIHYPFISGIDKQTKQTVWVAYNVNSSNFGDAGRTKFKPDPLLPTPIKQTNDDYKGLYKSHRLSRGHIAPKSSFDKNKQTTQQTFYFSNIIPQPQSLNAGVWKTVENWERKNQPLYVIGGATLNRNQTKRIFWKVILNKTNNHIYGLVFKKVGKKYCYQNINMSELESLTKLKFFSYYNISQRDFNIRGAC